MSLHAIDENTNSTASLLSSDRNLRIANYVWDTSTLAWIRQVDGAGGGPSSSVSVTATVGLTNTQLRASPLQVVGGNFASQVDDQTTHIYLGKAAAGSGTGSAVWSIKKITFSGSLISTSWAGGSDAFTNIWNNRAALSYS